MDVALPAIHRAKNDQRTVCGLPLAKRDLPQATARRVSDDPSSVTCSNCRRGWDPEAERTFLWRWGYGSIGGLADKLERTEGALVEKAKKVGFRTGCPPGHVRVCDLAEEVGYSRDSLVKILQSQGVSLYRSWSRREKRRPRFRVPIVERERAMKAVREWMRLETPNEAASRLGLSHTWLRTLLEQAGHVRPPKGVPWRLPPEVFDAVSQGAVRRPWRKVGPGHRRVSTSQVRGPCDGL